MQSGGDAKVTQIKKRLGLTVPIRLHKKLVDKAEYQGKTINALCLDIFWEYFEPERGKLPKPTDSMGVDRQQ